MEVYRLANSSFPTLDCVGGLYSSGRWHKAGNKNTYCGSSRALCVLERFIHDQDNAINVPLTMLTVHIPEQLAYEQFVDSDLPKGWDTTVVSKQGKTQNLGTTFLKESKFACLKVPSAIVPHEYNYILNPQHSEAHQITIIDSHEYQYDSRYKTLIKS